MGTPPPPSNTMAELIRQVASLTMQFDAMRKHIEESAASLCSSQAFHNRPRLKLDEPRFNETDTHGWIFKISQFFNYHQTPEEEGITIAFFCLDGAALTWYQWMHRNRQITSWAQFLERNC